MSLKGKVALVTGGARGIGRATVLRLAREGAKVAFCDLLTEEAHKVVAEAKKNGECFFVKADVTRKSDVEAMVKAVEEKFGAIDILVNNVGWWRNQLFLDSDEGDWQKVIGINLLGPLNVTRAVLPGMVSRGSGSIVNLGSDAGRAGAGFQVVYSGCKGAIIAMTKSLAREVTRYNIRVNAISPGPTDTPMLAELSKLDPKKYEAMVKLIPMRRMARPEEIAAAIVFLASDDASYITGQTLSVSGGMTMM